MSVIISPLIVPPTADPASLTAYHQQLTTYCLALLEEAAAIIPRIEETMPPGARSGRPLNFPLVFLGTAIDSVEQVPELRGIPLLDVARGRAILQLLETFRPIRDKVAALDRDVANMLNALRSSLTAEALGTYAVAKSLARGTGNPDLVACVENMQRDLGWRRKKP